MARPRSAKPKTQPVATRALRILRALRGHTFTGLSSKQLASALNCPASAVGLALNTLMAEGFVQQLENGRYAQSIAYLQDAEAHRAATNHLLSRIDETNARIAAGAR